MNKHDLVYRDQVVDTLKKNMAYAIFDEEGNYTTRGLKLLENINLVPPAQLREKGGKWILKQRRVVDDLRTTGYYLLTTYSCSECNAEMTCKTKFCPGCGAYMRSENNVSL